MVLDPFRVDLGDIFGNADGDEQFGHRAVTGADAIGKIGPVVGEKNPAIGARRRQTLALQPRNRLCCGRLGDPHPFGNIGHPRFAQFRDQIPDQFGVIFQQGARLLFPRPRKAVGLLFCRRRSVGHGQALSKA